MKISELLEGCCSDFCGLADLDIEGISHSSESLKRGCLYVLTRRIGEERARLSISTDNIRCIVCEKGDTVDECRAPVIYVDNAREALAYAYSRFYGLDYGRIKVIGVTGTNGKSTTATMIKSILEYCGEKVGFIGTGVISIGKDVISDEQYSMTTPDPDKLYAILRAMSDLGCTYAVMEVSSHALALAKVAPIRFYRALFTNLSAEHMDFHGDMESYYTCKARLFKQCDTGIFNLDDEYASRAYASAECKRIGAGILQDADVSAFNVELLGLSGSRYIYRGDGFTTPIALRVPGAFNVYNSLMALCCAISVGVKPCDAKHALAEISGINGRLSIINGEITVIIDYAHTARATEECLRFLSGEKGTGNLIAVFGCGGERDRAKRPLMARAAQRYADKIIVTTDNVRGESADSITADIITGFEYGTRYEIINDRERAITAAIVEAEPEDTVVILGKGPEKYSIDATGYRKFDERAIIDAALKLRKEIASENAHKT